MKKFSMIVESVLEEGNVLGNASTLPNASAMVKKGRIKFDRSEKVGNRVTFYGGKNEVAVWDGTSGTVTAL